MGLFYEHTRWHILIELVCIIVSLGRELAAAEPGHFPENLRQEGVLTDLTVEIVSALQEWPESYCDSCNRNMSEELNKWQLLSLCFIKCAQVFLWFLLYVVKLLNNKFCPGAADTSPLYWPCSAFNKHSGWKWVMFSLLKRVAPFLTPFAFFDFVSWIHMPFLNNPSILYLMSELCAITSKQEMLGPRSIWFQAKLSLFIIHLY